MPPAPSRPPRRPGPPSAGPAPPSPRRHQRHAGGEHEQDRVEHEPELRDAEVVLALERRQPDEERAREHGLAPARDEDRLLRARRGLRARPLPLTEEDPGTDDRERRAA